MVGIGGWILPAAALATAPGTGSVAGRVVDAASGAPVAWTVVRITDPTRGMIAGEDGTFAFDDVVPGRHEVVTAHVAYAEESVTVEVTAGDTVRVEIALRERAHEMNKVKVRAEADPRTFRPPVELSGKRLRESLGGTVAMTLADEPGLAERSMGPAPARPVLRGLDGARVLILEDGEPPGDLSATAPDHAVVIDPLGAERIDILRGPEAFLYGPSVLGGVVDVHRGNLLDGLPERFEGSARLHASSVDAGGAVQVRVRGTMKETGYLLDVVGRGSEDLRTPLGRLGNTDLTTRSGTFGVGRRFAGVQLGASAGRYDSDYGIPGGFLGGHPHGVDIELERTRWEAGAAMGLGERGFRRLELRGASTRYFHRELEAGDICGVSFGVVTREGTATVAFGSDDAAHGAALLRYEDRDFAAGCFSFVTPTVERTAGLGVLTEGREGPLAWQVAARCDARALRPAEPDTNKAGIVRDRTFTGFSGGASGKLALPSDMSLKLGISRAWRPPAIEELFAEGPHLAAYSYEIGNADLDPESALGLDLAVSWKTGAVATEVALFRNAIRRYILPLDSGELEYGQGSSGYLPRYRYQGRDAVMQGGEASFGWTPDDRWRLDASASWVRAEFDDDGEPLPRIPPLSGRVRCERTQGMWTVGVATRGAARQSRLGEFEEPTAGWLVFDASVEWRRISGGNVFQAVVLRGTNLMDAAYRNHLSRVKSIMPEAGRAIVLSWELRF